jgi:peptide-methionine (S)-S-oxide reductase
MGRLAKSVLIVFALLGVCLAVSFALIHATTANAAATIPDPVVDEHLAAQSGQEKVVLAGGCFWGIQLVYEHVKGVIHATSGYAGGTVANPGYELVSSGTTGHAESVEVVYDPSKITLGQLLKVFFSVAHDPTELNYQGPDHGTQYRSAIFFTTPDQKRIAEAYVNQLDQAKLFSRGIVTQIAPLKVFYKAEGYHQDYAVHNPDNPYIAAYDLPKVDHLKQQFPGLYITYP